MPILTNSLRSPDQRRSDQLTILKRRLPPPKTAGRFFKTAAETQQSIINSFDPTFDSDAETDGPISGSSYWGRNSSKLITSSSTNSLGIYSIEHVDSNIQRQQKHNHSQQQQQFQVSNNSSLILNEQQPQINYQDSTNDNDRDDEQQPSGEVILENNQLAISNPVQNNGNTQIVNDTTEPTQIVEYEQHYQQEQNIQNNNEKDEDEDEDDDSFEDGDDLFSRERASSFYGANNQDNDQILEEDNFGPLSQTELRKVLDEDYDMFYWKEKKNTTPSDEDKKSKRESVPVSEGPASPSLKENDEEDQLEHTTDHSQDTSLSKKSSLRTHHTLEMKKDDDRYTVTIVDNDDDNREENDDIEGGENENGESDKEDNRKRIITNESFQITMDQLTQLALRKVESPRTTSGRVPLFIEESNGNPRAAIVDGKLQRVKVSKQDTTHSNSSSFRSPHTMEKESKSISNWAIRSFAQCLGDIQDEHVRKGHRRRKKKKRAPQPSKPTLPQDTLSPNEITNGEQSTSTSL